MGLVAERNNVQGVGIVFESLISRIPETVISSDSASEALGPEDVKASTAAAPERATSSIILSDIYPQVQKQRR